MLFKTQLFGKIFRVQLEYETVLEFYSRLEAVPSKTKLLMMGTIALLLSYYQISALPLLNLERHEPHNLKFQLESFLFPQSNAINQDSISMIPYSAEL